MVHGGAIAIRRMMNLSSSFDHRFIDGFDAAQLIQNLRESLEQPALLFIQGAAASERVGNLDLTLKAAPVGALGSRSCRRRAAACV